MINRIFLDDPSIHKIKLIRAKATLEPTIFGYVPSVRIGRAKVTFTRSYCYLQMRYDKTLIKKLKEAFKGAQWLKDTKKWRIDVCYRNELRTELLVVLGMHYKLIT